MEFPRGTRLAVALVFSALCHAQPATPSDEIAVAVKSPETLAGYLESHRTIDWKFLRKTLGLKESEYWIAPCGSDVPAAEAPCSAELAAVLNPGQTIVIVRGGNISYTVEYLRYLQDAKGGWQFAGENSAIQRNSPSHHKFTRFGNKPFLAISSDHSQNGAATQQILEEWFDLTQPDFEPVLSITVDGGNFRFGFGVGRSIQTTLSLSETGGTETAMVFLTVHFVGVASLNQEAWYLGAYERQANQKKFVLRNASSLLDRRTPIPTVDFEELADPFSGISNEKLLTYALPGLQKIATSTDSEAGDRLRSVLGNATDTPEKRLLLGLLTKR